jgi:Lhr-like helicase
LTFKLCFFNSSKADCCHFERQRCQISCLLINRLLVIIKGTSSMWMLCNAKSFMHIYMFTCMQTVNALTTSLSAANFKVRSLHGKRSQQERTSALNAFKSGKANILVATDVAARGLHIPRLPYIVNYDFPSNLETYIHRVGRTGTLCFAPQFLRALTRLGDDLVTQHTVRADGDACRSCMALLHAHTIS